MITFDYGGRLGNRLFQYVIARLLAEQLGFHLEGEYKYNDTLTATEAKPGKRYKNHKVIVKDSAEIGNILEMVYENRHYHLSGFWQEAHYYIPNRDKIIGFFNEKAPDNESLDKKNIIMHVRLDDYKTFGTGGTVLDPQYYHDCLSREDFEKLYIISDVPDDPYFKYFARYNPVFPRGNEKEDFWLMTKFDRIISSNSTFSWWAAFLSNSSKIYIPSCWIRNSYDIKHSLQHVISGAAKGTLVPAGFINY